MPVFFLILAAAAASITAISPFLAAHKFRRHEVRRRRAARISTTPASASIVSVPAPAVSVGRRPTEVVGDHFADGLIEAIATAKAIATTEAIPTTKAIGAPTTGRSIIAAAAEVAATARTIAIAARAVTPGAIETAPRSAPRPSRSAATAGPASALLALIHLERSAGDHLAIQGLDGLSGVFVGRHSYEAEAPWTTRFPIKNDGDFGHFTPIGAEYVSKLVFGRPVVEIAYVELPTHGDDTPSRL